MMQPSKRLAIAAGLVLFSCASVVLATPRMQVETVVDGLESPWSMAFLPSGNLLISERSGSLHIAVPGAGPGPAIAGLPDVDEGGQGGLLDVVADSEFASNRIIRFCYTEAADRDETNGTAVASARLEDDESRLSDVRVIFRQQPKLKGRHHFGCRIVEAADGTLFITLGERYAGMDSAQTLDNHLGKIVRINKDGSVPQDNPFVGRRDALAEVWSYGHRNPQGMALDSLGRLWAHEHGPQGGDELNLIQPGRNYGWPVITYGEKYGGGKIGDGITAQDGMEQPLVHWIPSIAISGLAVLDSERYPVDWRGSLFVGSLKFRRLERIKLDDAAVAPRVLAQEIVLEDIGRIRDVRQGPDGLLYLLSEAPGKIMRLLPPSE